MSNDTPKRLVSVPIAGYIMVEIDGSIEPKNSMGWDEPTAFEQAATEAADTLLADLEFPTEIRYSVAEWGINAYAKISAGNLLYVDLNTVSDEGLIDDDEGGEE